VVVVTLFILAVLIFIVRLRKGGPGENAKSWDEIHL